MKELKFYALCQEFGENKLQPINVIHDGLLERVKKDIRKNKCYQEIKDSVKLELMSKYWSRTEYEFIVSNWSGQDFEQKIDVWYQLEPNLDLITQLVIMYVAPRKGRKIINDKN